MRSNPGVTPVEGVAWAVLGLGVAIYVISFVVIGNAGYADSTTAAEAWLSFGGMLAIASFAPAIILTGVRQLVPALRGVPRGEEVTYAEDGGTESKP